VGVHQVCSNKILVVKIGPVPGVIYFSYNNVYREKIILLKSQRARGKYPNTAATMSIESGQTATMLRLALLYILVVLSTENESLICHTII
jgi:hypothetical protein